MVWSCACVTFFVYQLTCKILKWINCAARREFDEKNNKRDLNGFPGSSSRYKQVRIIVEKFRCPNNYLGSVQRILCSSYMNRRILLSLPFCIDLLLSHVLVSGYQRNRLGSRNQSPIYQSQCLGPLSQLQTSSRS